MFGFSLPKLLFTILIVVVVIYGFKAITRLQERRKAVDSRARRGKPLDAEDMVACPVCGVYVSAGGARACERGDCPYPH